MVAIDISEGENLEGFPLQLRWLNNGGNLSDLN